MVASGIAAGVSVVLASAAFTLEYAIGGTGNVSLSTVLGAMVGVHTLIGIGEGIITALDGRRGARGPTGPRVRRFGSRSSRRRPRCAGAEHGELAMANTEASTRTRIGIAGLLVAGVLLALGLAAFASPFASSEPDGLERVAVDKGFDGTARNSATADSPLADYSVRNVDNEKVSTGLSGIIGVTITLLVAAAVFGGLWYAVRRRSGSRPLAAGT